MGGQWCRIPIKTTVAISISLLLELKSTTFKKKSVVDLRFVNMFACVSEIFDWSSLFHLIKKNLLLKSKKCSALGIAIISFILRESPLQHVNQTSCQLLVQADVTNVNINFLTPYLSHSQNEMIFKKAGSYLCILPRRKWQVMAGVPCPHFKFSHFL